MRQNWKRLERNKHDNMHLQQVTIERVSFFDCNSPGKTSTIYITCPACFKRSLTKAVIFLKICVTFHIKWQDFSRISIYVLALSLVFIVDPNKKNVKNIFFFFSCIFAFAFIRLCRWFCSSHALKWKKVPVAERN